MKQATLRKLTDQALDLLDTCAIAELLPPELLQGMMSLPEALRTLHRPTVAATQRSGNRTTSGAATSDSRRTAGA